MIAAKKGVNHLDRATQVSFMAEFQELLDFPRTEAQDRRQARPSEGDGG